MKQLFLIVVLVSLSREVSSQEWISVYSQNVNDIGSHIIHDQPGNIFIQGGNEQSTFVVKYNKLGIKQWDDIFTNPYDTNFFPNPSGIEVDNNGNIVSTGIYPRSFDTVTFESESVVITNKYNSSGTLQWSKRAGENESISFFSSNARIKIDASGNTIVGAAYFDNTNSEFGNVIIKYNPQGDTLWTRKFTGQYKVFNDMTMDVSGNIYLTGVEISDTASSINSITMKLDQNGNVVWSSFFTNESDGGISLFVDNSGNVFVTGEHYPKSSEDANFFTIKYNSIGDTLWTRIYSSPENYNERPFKIFADNTGNVYVGGTTEHSTDPPFVDGVTLVKYSSIGEELWVRETFDPERRYFLNGMDLDVQGNIYFSGWLVYFFGGDYAFGLKYNSSGDTVWSSQYTNSIEKAYGSALTVDNSQNVYITGGESSDGTTYDCITLKYATAIGINQTSSEVPASFLLSQNYPNPFNPNTIIPFSLKKQSHVRLVIYDILGKEISVLINGTLTEGSYQYNFDGSNLSSGIYFYKLEAGNFKGTKKMLMGK